MATADIASPFDILADKAIDATGFYDQFVTASSISVPSFTTAGGKDGQISTSSASTILKHNAFILDSDAFANLQAYLVAGMRLPEDKAAFELRYPRNLLEPYTKNESSEFYNKLLQCLTAINKHCVSFKKGTMNETIKLAGKIANFADEAVEGSKVLSDALEVLIKPGARSDDPTVEQALANFSSTVTTLISRARSAKDDCDKMFKDLSDFHTVTVEDGKTIKPLDTAADRVLPNIADHDKKTAEKMAKARDELNGIVGRQNSMQDNSGRRMVTAGKYVMLFSPAAGIALVLIGIQREKDAAKEIERLNREFETHFNSCNEELQKGMRLRTVTKNLSDAIDNVVGTIEKAISTLQSMIGSFSKLINGLENIDDDLNNAFIALQDNLSFKRLGARNQLENAAKKWMLVVSLARNFEENGLAIVQTPESLREQPSVVEILASTYGGEDVTLYSKVLFNHGSSVIVRSVDPGFPEPWAGMPKTISVLHQYGDSMRILACRTYTGKDYNYVLKPGPPETINDENAQLREVQPSPAHPTSNIQILAVVWGQAIITDHAVYQRIHEAYANNGTVSFTNDGIGGGNDPWFGVRKSGAIYYKIKGGTEIKQLVGKEGEQVKFP